MADTPTRKAASKSTARSRRTTSKTEESPGAQQNPELQGSDEIRTAIISGLSFATKAVQYAVVDGRAIFEGDIDLGSVEEVEASNSAMRGIGIEEGVVILTNSGCTTPSPTGRRTR
jgi:hypothetical protein